MHKTIRQFHLNNKENRIISWWWAKTLNFHVNNRYAILIFHSGFPLLYSIIQFIWVTQNVQIKLLHEHFLCHILLHILLRTHTHSVKTQKILNKGIFYPSAVFVSRPFLPFDHFWPSFGHFTTTTRNNTISQFNIRVYQLQLSRPKSKDFMFQPN